MKLPMKVYSLAKAGDKAAMAFKQQYGEMPGEYQNGMWESFKQQFENNETLSDDDITAALGEQQPAMTPEEKKATKAIEGYGDKYSQPTDPLFGFDEEGFELDDNGDRITEQSVGDAELEEQSKRHEDKITLKSGKEALEYVGIDDIIEHYEVNGDADRILDSIRRYTHAPEINSLKEAATYLSDEDIIEFMENEDPEGMEATLDSLSRYVSGPGSDDNYESDLMGDIYADARPNHTKLSEMIRSNLVDDSEINANLKKWIGNDKLQKMADQLDTDIDNLPTEEMIKSLSDDEVGRFMSEYDIDTSWWDEPDDDYESDLEENYESDLGEKQSNNTNSDYSKVEEYVNKTGWSGEEDLDEIKEELTNEFPNVDSKIIDDIAEKTYNDIIIPMYEEYGDMNDRGRDDFIPRKTEYTPEMARLGLSKYDIEAMDKEWNETKGGKTIPHETTIKDFKDMVDWDIYDSEEQLRKSFDTYLGGKYLTDEEKQEVVDYFKANYKAPTLKSFEDVKDPKIKSVASEMDSILANSALGKSLYRAGQAEINVKPAESNGQQGTKIEFNAELDYEDMHKLMDKFNEVFKKNNIDSYFEMDSSGRAVAYIW